MLAVDGGAGPGRAGERGGREVGRRNGEREREGSRGKLGWIYRAWRNNRSKRNRSRSTKARRAIHILRFRQVPSEKGQRAPGSCVGAPYRPRHKPPAVPDVRGSPQVGTGALTPAEWGSVHGRRRRGPFTERPVGRRVCESIATCSLLLAAAHGQVWRPTSSR